MISTKNNPCYQCPERWIKKIDGKTTTCHSTCEKHKAKTEENNKIKEQVIKGRNALQKEIEYNIRNCNRNGNYKRKNYKW